MYRRGNSASNDVSLICEIVGKVLLKMKMKGLTDMGFAKHIYVFSASV